MANNNDVNTSEDVKRKITFEPVQEEDNPVNSRYNKLSAMSTEELRVERQRAMEKWNFDFENEIPLNGDWVWEKVPVQLPENRDVVTSMKKNHTDSARNV